MPAEVVAHLSFKDQFVLAASRPALGSAEASRVGISKRVDNHFVEGENVRAPTRRPQAARSERSTRAGVHRPAASRLNFSKAGNLGM